MLIAMATKRWERAQVATVTRRDGWAKLVAAFDAARLLHQDGEAYEPPEVVLEMVEWTPRIPRRWACSRCGWLGPTSPDLSPRGWCEDCRMVGCSTYRTYRRGLWIRVTDARREILADMDPSDLTLEGFPDLSLVDFWRLYLGCSTRLDSFAVYTAAAEREVTRIEYHLEKRP